jgi:uncharacterized membrane protein YfcA
MDLLHLLAVFLLGFGSMFIGTTTGGVGLIVVPVLILLGLSPHASIATTRLAVFTGDLIALRAFDRAGKVTHSLVTPVLLLSVLGALAGSYVLLLTPGPLAEKILGIFILCTLAFSLWKRNAGLVPDRSPGALRIAAGYAATFFLSILGTYFSAASGMLGRTAFISFFGLTYLESAALRKIQGLAMGIVSLLIFAWNGLIDVPISLVLVPSMVLGSFIGSRYALRKGDRWAQIVFLGVVFFAALQLLF